MGEVVQKALKQVGIEVELGDGEIEAIASQFRPEVHHGHAEAADGTSASNAMEDAGFVGAQPRSVSLDRGDVCMQTFAWPFNSCGGQFSGTVHWRVGVLGGHTVDLEIRAVLRPSQS